MCMRAFITGLNSGLERAMTIVLRFACLGEDIQVNFNIRAVSQLESRCVFLTRSGGISKLAVLLPSPSTARGKCHKDSSYLGKAHIVCTISHVVFINLLFKLCDVSPVNYHKLSCCQPNYPPVGDPLFRAIPLSGEMVVLPFSKTYTEPSLQEQVPSTEVGGGGGHFMSSFKKIHLIQKLLGGLRMGIPQVSGSILNEENG
jgi:hypothetical protein